MIRAQIPQDVTEYKEELFFGLTLRKLIAVLAVLAIIVPAYIFGSKIIDKSILIYIMAVPCVPIILIGFKEMDGMPFEKYAKLIWDFYTKEQRRKFVYLPSEEVRSDEIKSVLLNGEKMLRKDEIQKEKKAAKAEKKMKKAEKKKLQKGRKDKKNAD